jgi:hypothetical protein
MSGPVNQWVALILTPQFQMKPREVGGFAQSLPKLVTELGQEPSLYIQAPSIMDHSELL